jgi:hypothetical protein
MPLGRKYDETSVGSRSDGLSLSVKVDEEPDLNKDGHGVYASSSKSPRSTTFPPECVTSGNSSGGFFRRVLGRLLPRRN